jgi:hypothetical protein
MYDGDLTRVVCRGADAAKLRVDSRRDVSIIVNMFMTR